MTLSHITKVTTHSFQKHVKAKQIYVLEQKYSILKIKKKTKTKLNVKAQINGARKEPCYFFLLSNNMTKFTGNLPSELIWC